MSPDHEALTERARSLGVETSYWDVSGTLHHAPAETLTALVDILEADRRGDPTQLPAVVVADGSAVPIGVLGGVELVVDDGTVIALAGHDGTVVLPDDLPIGCHLLRGGIGDDVEEATVVVAPPRMPRDRRLDDPVGGVFVPAYALWDTDDPDPSYRHLHALASRLAGHHLAVVCTLPLYATFLDEPFDPSPYSPISRLHWSEAYLDLPGRVTADATPLVDWRAVARRRRLELLSLAADLDGPTGAALDDFVRARRDIADFARFQTARASVCDSGHRRTTVERSYQLGQLLAHRQLGSIEADTTTILALDLPIGTHPDGFETHAHPELFADTMSVGAPPDAFFTDGQNWGFSPPLPGAGRRSGHRLWRQMIERAGEHASILRIDHVMGVQRLWWIPEDRPTGEGAYVRYPREELLAVIAAAATRSRTTVVGEDLGTISDEVREALDRWGTIGLYEEQFHLAERPLPRPGRDRVAGLRTHDMSPFAALRTETPEQLDAYRCQLGVELGHDVSDDGLVDAALERLAATDSVVVLADLDDLLEESTPHNVPGRVLPTIWRRRLPKPTAEVLTEPAVARRLAVVAGRARDDHRGEET
ncbi:MAG: 4-alpha-glucanotransferase [Desertimonas sp.]